jgi:hypothetical protein
MNKWEYCVLVGVSNIETHYPRLYRFTSNGFEIVSDFQRRSEDEAVLVAKAIFQLGEEGWELVVDQTFGDHAIQNRSSSLWFKRPKSV